MNSTLQNDEYVDSTPLLEDPTALRERAEQEGFLFFRGLLPAEAVLQVRADVLGVIDRHGWREPGQGPLGGRIDIEAINRVPDEVMRADIGITNAAYHDIQKLERMHRLPHHPKLVGLFEALFGTEVLVHPRHIVRTITPHRDVVPTPPHQDFPLIQGADTTWTAWYPLGDCPRELGGLTVLRASHRNGFLPVMPAKGAGGIAVPLCPGENQWVSGDFATGDVLIFPCYTIHRALACRQKQFIRLSMDVRYQPAEEPVEQKSLLPHCELSWDQIYTGWEADDLKYYWQRQPLSLSPWDDTLTQPRRRIC